MKFHAIGAAALALLACTAPNPGYIGEGAQDGAVAPDQGADLAVSGSSDLAPVCQDGQRACLASTASAGCTSGQYALDRKCPSGSTCKTGYCEAPPQMPGTPIGLPCDNSPGAQENQCFVNTQGGADALSCEPFVVGATLDVRWVCAKPIGQGLPGATCTVGTDCRSGFCGDNGTCFRACQGDNDCPLQPNGRRLACHNVKIVVEGVMLEQGSCIP